MEKYLYFELTKRWPNILIKINYLALLAKSIDPRVWYLKSFSLLIHEPVEGCVILEKKNKKNYSIFQASRNK